jgi:predicted MPP superfamily phosphohydrolase
LLQFFINLLLVFFLCLAQWRIGVACVRFAVGRWSPERVRLLRVLLLLTGVALFAGFLLGFTEIRARLPFTSRWIGMASGAAQLWLFTSSTGCALYLLFRLLTGRIPSPPFDPSRRRAVNAAGGALLASPFLVAGYGAFIERTNFQVREVDIPLSGLPPDLDGLRLLQLSDIHLSAFLSEQELARAIDAANHTRAHLALVTGDLISTRGDPLDACLRQLARLKCDAGIFGCMGNHERFSGAERYATEQGARLGIRFLRGEHQQLRFGASNLNLAGVDYQRIAMSRTGYLQSADKMIVPGALNVLLSHNPDVFPVAAAQGYDLTLAGHTHGGQITVEILSRSINPARFFTPYVYGLYHLKPGGRQAAAYVSSGIGTIGVPARVGAPPEISVLRLRKA